MAGRSLSPDETRRLAFVRVLVMRAEEESKSPPPFSFDCLNRIHDATESFLALACQHYQVKIPRGFMDFWTVLDGKHGGPLPNRTEMERLNRARVNLKHYGIEPAGHEIQEAIRAARVFLENECSTIFGVSLEEVTLDQYVRSERARMLLASADENRKTGEWIEAMADLVVALDAVIREYRERKQIGHRRSVFDNISDFTFVQMMDDKVKSSLQALDGAVMLIGFGIDYRQYGRFKGATPSVTHSIDGRRWINTRQDWPQPTRSEFEWCREFVVRTALRLYSFDYDIRSHSQFDKPAGEGEPVDVEGEE